MLTVGQLARIFRVSTKTLRHYDAIGLFTPAKVGGDNLYRYYAPEQLNELKRILLLRSMKVGIGIIRELKCCGALYDDERIKRILEEQAALIRDEIARQHALLHSVEQILSDMENAGKLDREVRIVRRAAFTVVGMEWHSSDSGGSISDLWERFELREHEVGHIINPDISYGLGIPGKDGLFSYVAGFEVGEAEIPHGMVKVEVPEQSYAVFSHQGNVEGIVHTMSGIYECWLPQNGLVPVEAIDYELYDARFLGADHADTEIDLYIPIHME